MTRKGVSKTNLDKKNDSKQKEKYRTEKKVIYKKVKKKRFKLKIHTVLIAVALLYMLGYSIYSAMHKPISNIFISGNTYYSDWQIIEMAGLSNYPSSIAHPNNIIENKLEKNILIHKATVTKKFFTQVYIKIEENKPLFYDNTKGATVFADLQTRNDKYDTPVLTNQMDEKLYKELVKNMAKMDINVFRKISEIKYDPDEVDKERILFTMTDGNYVYITMLKFYLLNDYNSIVKEFDNKKGILYLNSGGYFKIIEN
jgi:cell division septal protein FtsQ